MSGTKLPINHYIYPYIGQVKGMPVYLAGIGGTEYQGRINRPEGYCWHQILYCEKGCGTLKYDGVTVRITPGCYYFLPAYYPHEYYPDEKKWDVRWLVFEGKGCKEILSELGMTKPFTVNFENANVLHRLYRDIFIALKTDKIFGNYTCAGLVYQYIMEFYRLTLDSSPNGGGYSDVLLPALNYIDEHLLEDFSISALAEYVGVSQQYLGRVFRQTMNLRPNEYVTTRRLHEAEHLLVETNLSSAQIAKECSFSDAGYFCTVFKRYEKMTPTEYRNKHCSRG